MSNNRKPILEYEGLYEISDDGKVWSCISHKYLKPKLNKGYEQVNLYKEKVCKSFSVHRLVALAFIPNPENKREINHIDENKLNNSVENLEWVTSKENANHGTRNQRIREWVLAHPILKDSERLGYRKIKMAYGKSPIEVAQIDISTGEIIATYPSIAEAGRKNGFKNGSICWCCLGKQKTAYGYKWKRLG